MPQPDSQLLTNHQQPQLKYHGLLMSQLPAILQQPHTKFILMTIVVTVKCSTSIQVFHQSQLVLHFQVSQLAKLTMLMSQQSTLLVRAPIQPHLQYMQALFPQRYLQCICQHQQPVQSQLAGHLPQVMEDCHSHSTQSTLMLDKLVLQLQLLLLQALIRTITLHHH